MSAPTYFIGLDLDLTHKALIATIGTKPWKTVAGPNTFPDSVAGFQELVTWLSGHHCTKKESVLCMPASGFIGEPLAYFLTARGYRVAIEPPLKIKRGCSSTAANGHLPDSREVAEYACRHCAQLHPWQPSPEMLSKIQLLVAGRRPSTPARAKSKTKSNGHGIAALSRTERAGLVDQEIRHLLAPRRTIADEWPSF